jgi:hypothetical protein
VVCPHHHIRKLEFKSSNLFLSEQQFPIVKTEAACSSETSVNNYQTTCSHVSAVCCVVTFLAHQLPYPVAQRCLDSHSCTHSRLKFNSQLQEFCCRHLNEIERRLGRAHRRERESHVFGSWHGSVDTAAAYGLNDRGVPCRGKRWFSPQLLDRLWGLSSLLSNGYRGLFPGGKAAGA